MRVVNLFAGPGAGKSTTAAGLFHVLKRDGENVELVGEYAKDLVWEGRLDVLRDQIYVLGKQHQRIARLRGKVDIAIVDSPLLLCRVYVRHALPEPHQIELRYAIAQTALEAYRTFDNLNVFIERAKPYIKVGRGQSEDEARGLDAEIRGMLDEVGVPYEVVRGDAQAVENIQALLYDRAGRLKRACHRCGTPTAALTAGGFPECDRCFDARGGGVLFQAESHGGRGCGREDCPTCV